METREYYKAVFSNRSNYRKKTDEQIDLLIARDVRIDSLLESYESISEADTKFYWLHVIIYLLSRFSPRKLDTNRVRSYIAEFEEKLSSNDLFLRNAIVKVFLEYPKSSEQLYSLLKSCNLKKIDEYGYILEIYRYRDSLNIFLLGEISKQSQNVERQNIRLLFQCKFVLERSELKNLLSKDLLMSIEDFAVSQQIHTDNYRILCGIYPILINDSSSPLLDLSSFVKKLNNAEYKYLIEESLNQEVPATTFIEMLISGVEQVQEGSLQPNDISIVSSYLSHYMSDKTVSDKILILYDKMLHTRSLNRSETLDPLRCLYDGGKNTSLISKFRKKVVNWLSEKNPIINLYMPGIIPILYKDDSDQFLEDWISWKSNTDIGTWIRIITSHIRTFYSPSGDHPSLIPIKNRLETIAEEMGLDRRKIYGRDEIADPNNLKRINKVLFFMEFIKHNPLELQRISSNQESYPLMSGLFGVDWVRNRIENNLITHPFFLILNYEQSNYLDTIEKILGEIVSIIPLDKLHPAFKHIRGSTTFFDTVAEIYTLYLFLSNGVNFEDSEYKLSNNKKIDFLLEKNGKRVLIEVFNVRPFGPMQHLGGVWRSPEMIKDAIITKINRKKLEETAADEFTDIPLIFAIDVTAEKPDDLDIINALRGTIEIKVNIETGQQQLGHQQDSIFHLNPFSKRIAGFLWIWQGYNIDTIRVDFTRNPSIELPEWVSDILNEYPPIYG
ncbi:MAG: hypothetical protein ACTSP4_01650 [Candidatus Hodarchaeales archaeon]